MIRRTRAHNVWFDHKIACPANQQEMLYAVTADHYEPAPTATDAEATTPSRDCSWQARLSAAFRSQSQRLAAPTTPPPIIW